MITRQLASRFLRSAKTKLEEEGRLLNADLSTTFDIELADTKNQLTSRKSRLSYTTTATNQLGKFHTMLAPNIQSALASIASQPFEFVNPKSPVMRALKGQGLIEINETYPDPNAPEKFAARATDAGKALIPSATNTPVDPFAGQVATTAPTNGAATEEVTNTAAPKRKGAPRGPRVVPVIQHAGGRMTLPPAPVGGGRGRQKGSESYPFSKLLPPDATGYDSFLVVATEAMPDPSKTMKMTVFSANKRYKLANAPNKYEIRPENDGVRVYRVA